MKENGRKYFEDDVFSQQATGKKECITQRKVKKQVVFK